MQIDHLREQQGVSSGHFCVKEHVGMSSATTEEAPSRATANVGNKRNMVCEL